MHHLEQRVEKRVAPRSQQVTRSMITWFSALKILRWLSGFSFLCHGCKLKRQLLVFQRNGDLSAFFCEAGACIYQVDDNKSFQLRQALLSIWSEQDLEVSHLHHYTPSTLLLLPTNPAIISIPVSCQMLVPFISLLIFYCLIKYASKRRYHQSDWIQQWYVHWWPFV